MIIDLTQSISPTLKQFPGSPDVAFIKWSKYEIEGYNLEVMFLSTHTGTHMDAPSHFIKEGYSVDKIDVNRFIMSSTHIIRIHKDPNELISLEDIVNSGVSINTGDSIVFSTGWEKHYFSDNYMSSNPGLSIEAATYLIDNKINTVAIDTPSIDAGKDSSFIAHQALLKNNIIIIENLCNLEKINKNNFTFIAVPLKIIGATGSPIRALAII